MTAHPITEDPMPYAQAAAQLVEDMWAELEDSRRPRTTTRTPIPGETPLPLEVPCG